MKTGIPPIDATLQRFPTNRSLPGWVSRPRASRLRIDLLRQIQVEHRAQVPRVSHREVPVAVVHEDVCLARFLRHAFGSRPWKRTIARSSAVAAAIGGIDESNPCGMSTHTRGRFLWPRKDSVSSTLRSSSQ